MQACIQAVVKLILVEFLVLLATASKQLAIADTAINPQGICSLLVLPKHSYNCQEYKVTTSDGYILGMQRISSKAQQPTRGPALLYHGIMQGGDIWVLNGEEESLGFVLAGRGYDVWLGSTRSSKFSYGHVSHKTSDPEYWNWSLDDLALQDLPSMLQFVHSESNRPIFFVGHSQGSMAAFASFTRGNTASLVKRAAMLSPVTYLKHVTSPFASAVASLFLDKVLLDMGVCQFNLSSNAAKLIIDAVCNHIKQTNCYNDSLSLVTGSNCCIDKSLMGYYERFELQATSMKNIAHMAQLLRTGRFGMYDYGWLRNLAHYGDFFPPPYNLNAIPRGLPLLLIHGGRDVLANQQAVSDLLQFSPGAHDIFVPNYAHVDFVLGMSAKSQVYDALVSFFES